MYMIVFKEREGISDSGNGILGFISEIEGGC